MIVKVCDALCGAGKTQSCINLMNHDLEHRYVFITPYLDEVDRIKKSCAGRRFVSPERSFRNSYSKLQDLHSLLRNGENIASTHALFSMATEETKELIRSNHYVLVLDEVIDLFQPLQMDGGDINLLVRNHIAQKDGDNVVWKDDEYNGSAFSELMQMSKSRNLVDYDGEFFFWALPPDVFKCFDDAYVLTYLFEYQFQKYYFEINDIQYELIGTIKKDGAYQFCPLTEMNRKRNLLDKVHIIENDKYNEIGNKAFSLSSGWFERSCREEGKPSIIRLKNNLYNVFRKVDGEDKLWTTLNAYRHELRGKGYSSSFITFNKRATNEFSNRHYLAYCINVFMMPWMKNYLARIGVESKEISQDMYALSVLIQWMFRSAIRNGEEIWMYIPSRRMRYLLKEWLKNLAVGEDLREIKFCGGKTRTRETALKKKNREKEKKVK